MKFLLLWIVAITFQNVRSEVFSSTTGMESLLRAEEVMIKDLETYVKAQKDRNSHFEQKLSHLKEEHNKAMADVTKFIAVPMNAYRLTRRLTVEFDELVRLANDSSVDQEYITKCNQSASALGFPKKSDYEGVKDAIFRLQDTYDLEAHDLASGLINGIDYGVKLRASECYDMGLHAYNAKNYYYATSWLQEAVDRVKVEQPPTVFAMKPLQLLAELYQKANHASGAISIVTKMLQIDPGNQKASDMMQSLTQDLLANFRAGEKEKPVDVSADRLFEKNTTNVPLTQVYYAGCRGEFEMAPAEQAKLKCRYESHESPFLKIGPFKVEEVNRDPAIWLYYDVISDEEIEILKVLAKPKLARAGVVQDQTKLTSKVSSYRVSQSGWLYPNEHPVMKTINNRIKDITALSIEDVEPLQVGNYGIGGHYISHKDYHDTVEQTGPILGNRFNTLMFYLSDVEQGGATVFIYPRVMLRPKKGTAVVWFNLFTDGNGNYRTLHAACPVLVGSKWVANSWNHYGAQMFIRPCGLEKDSPSEEEAKQIKSIYP